MINMPEGSDVLRFTTLLPQYIKSRGTSPKVRTAQAALKQVLYYLIFIYPVFSVDPSTRAKLSAAIDNLRKSGKLSTMRIQDPQ